MGKRVLDGFVIEEAAILCPECNSPFRTEVVTEPRKVNSSDIIEADLHRVFNDPELRSLLLSACPNCTFCAWTSSFKPFKLRAELLKKETQIAPCKKFALAVKWARQKKVHALDIAFIAVNGLWCAREASEPDNLWLELAIFEHEKGMAITPSRPQEEGMAHLLMGELYRQHKDFEKALAEYELAAQDSSVSAIILDHQKTMCRRGQYGFAALPLKIARLYFEIEDISTDKKDMDFSPAPAESTAASPAANNVSATATSKESAAAITGESAAGAKSVDSVVSRVEPPAVPKDPTREPAPKAEQESKPETAAIPGSAGSLPASTPAKSDPAPEEEARPLLAAISSLFSSSTKSILDQYAAEAEAESAKAADDLSSLSKELEKTAESVSTKAGEPPALPARPLQKEPVAKEAPAEQAAFMAATGTESAKPINAAPLRTSHAASAHAASAHAAPSAAGSIVSADATIKAPAQAPAAPLAPAQAPAAPVAPAQPPAAPVAPAQPPSAPAAPAAIPGSAAFQAAPTPTSIKPVSSPSAKTATPPLVSEEEDIPAPKKNFEEPKTVALGSLSTPKKKEAPVSKPRPKNTADIIPQLAVAPDPEEIQRASNPRLKAIAPKPEAKPVLPAAPPAAKAATPTPAQAPAAQKQEAAEAKKEPVIRSRASVITAPPASSVSLSVTSIAAPTPAAQQPAKQESPVPILSEPARKVKKKRIKPPREDHHFARHPVVLNTRPNENGWFNDYGNGNFAAPAAQSVRDERVETQQRPSERQADRQQQKHQAAAQTQEAAASEAGAPLPGLAIDDQYRRDYTDAINRVESYLSLSRRIQARNWMKL